MKTLLRAGVSALFFVSLFGCGPTVKPEYKDLVPTEGLDDVIDLDPKPGETPSPFGSPGGLMMFYKSSAGLGNLYKQYKERFTTKLEGYKLIMDCGGENESFNIAAAKAPSSSVLVSGSTLTPDTIQVNLSKGDNPSVISLPKSGKCDWTPEAKDICEFFTPEQCRIAPKK